MPLIDLVDLDSQRDGNLTLDDTVQLAHKKTLQEWGESETKTTVVISVLNSSTWM